MHLRIELTIDGGFAYLPGLAKPLVVDAAQLADDEAKRLQKLCAASLANTNRDAKSRGAPTPDARRYRLIIEIENTRQRIEASDPVVDEATAELIAFVRERGKRD